MPSTLIDVFATTERSSVVLIQNEAPLWISIGVLRRNQRIGQQHTSETLWSQPSGTFATNAFQTASSGWMDMVNEALETWMHYIIGLSLTTVAKVVLRLVTVDLLLLHHFLG